MRQYLESKWEYYWSVQRRSAAFSLVTDLAVVESTRSGNDIIRDVVNIIRDGYVAYICSINQSFEYYSRATKYFEEEIRRGLSEELDMALDNWRKSNGEQ